MSEPDNSLLMIDVENDRDLLREFVSESREHLEAIEQETLALEANPTEIRTLNALFAVFHTFKGTAGLLNLTPIKILAHELESLLDLARRNKLLMTSKMIELVLRGEDTLKECIQQIEEQLGRKDVGSVTVPHRELIQDIHAAIQANIQTTTETPRRETLAHVPQTAVQSTVRIEVSKLDALVDLMGELLTTYSQLSRDVRHLLANNEDSFRNMPQLGYITGELRWLTLSMRMVPIGPTFQKMPRLVRDLAARAGKHVQLTLLGEETELDRALVEAIRDPVLHMVRNAIDHGIEKPEVRLAAGKPATGSIRLNAFHKDGFVNIEISDDGAGLDKERILLKAMECGLAPAGSSLSEQEIFQFIFSAGLSTAQAVSDISGRGVGMDVVRRNVEKLFGKIEIKSIPGVGSTFTLTLPLTMAIIDGLLVELGTECYIIPVLSVRESFRPTPAMISTAQDAGEMMNIGDSRPLLRVHKRLGITPPPNSAECMVVRIETEQQEHCLLVDRVLGNQQVVIKSLGDSLGKNAHLAGTTILADGRVGLILDLSSLVKPTRAIE